MLRLWDVKTGQSLGALARVAQDQVLAVSPEGHYRGPPQLEGQLIYVVQTEHGQDLLSPEEFRTRYGWKNDPERVRLGER